MQNLVLKKVHQKVLALLKVHKIVPKRVHFPPKKFSIKCFKKHFKKHFWQFGIYMLVKGKSKQTVSKIWSFHGSGGDFTCTLFCWILDSDHHAWNSAIHWKVKQLAKLRAGYTYKKTLSKNTFLTNTLWKSKSESCWSYLSENVWHPMVYGRSVTVRRQKLGGGPTVAQSNIKTSCQS